ncbi:MAG: glycosyltransferase family 39 protein [Acidimicrobiia bacterium]
MTSRRASALLGLIALTAFGLELVFLVSGQHGLTGGLDAGYDESIYVGASWLLRQGHLPYRDFVYVFPPGFLAVLWPSTTAAGIVGGPALALTAARVVSCLVGAVNVYLVGRIGWRWLGVAGGLTAALLFATTPVVLDAEAVVLQEPFVLLAVLLALALVSARPELGGRRLVAVALLLGFAASIKLVAGVFVVPVVVAAAFTRPLVDRVRFLVWSVVPLVVSTAGLMLWLGWRTPYEQIFAAQLLRPRAGEGLSRVDSLLPLLRGRTELSGSIADLSPWVAVGAYAIVCVLASARRGPARLWGLTGLAVGGVLLASPSYFPHYGVLLAPAVALLLAWTATVAFRALTVHTSPRAVAAGVVCVGLVLAGLQLHSGLAAAERWERTGPGPRLTHALRQPACVVPVRPQLLLDVDRVPEPGPRGVVFLDVYGSALLAALHQTVRSHNFSAADAPSVQAEIRRQSRGCARTLMVDRRCLLGRLDLTAATERWLRAHGRVVVSRGCVQLLARRAAPAKR